MGKLNYCGICNIKLDPYDTYQYKDMLVCGECYKVASGYPDLSNEEIKTRVLNERNEKNNRIDNFILVTVPQIEGKRIVKYFNMITSELVIGTGIFSELEASVFDLFGTTGAYSDKLKEIKEKVFNDLINQAVSVGANGIIGADAEYMKIGNNMVMFSVTGTPVIIKDID